MSIVEQVDKLSPRAVEAVEKLTLRWIFQAVLDFGAAASEIFRESPDEVKDIAEDITRELLDRLPGFNTPQRVFGTVDYKKARYVILPEQTVRQALFIDSKAEKDDDTATMQMSQTSLSVRQSRAGKLVNERGHLPCISTYEGKQYLTTTCLIHFHYEDRRGKHHLKSATLCAVPNGLLQDTYNPSAADTFWNAGRNAPTRGEDFRVRLNFAKLAAKTIWRVQTISYTAGCTGTWKA